MDREQDADDVTREVLIAVRRTFITPFDRGNIRDLITSMDNSIDQMQKTAKGIMLFDVTEFTPQMKEMADAVVKCAQLVQEAVPLLKSISVAGGAYQRLDRANLAARRPRRRTARHRPARRSIRPRSSRTRWRFSSATKSTIIWKRSSIGSTTSPTSCTASSSSTFDATEAIATMDAGALALPLLIALIVVALAFDFLNGMNDAANSIATIVSTRVLRPQYAVAWAAFFNFIAFLFFGLHVAETVGRGIVEADIVNEHVIFGALAGAIIWQIITKRLGIPSSSSHALIGGLVGAGVAKAGVSAVVWQRRRQDRAGDLLARRASAVCSRCC